MGTQPTLAGTVRSVVPVFAAVAKVAGPMFGADATAANRRPTLPLLAKGTVVTVRAKQAI